MGKNYTITTVDVGKLAEDVFAAYRMVKDDERIFIITNEETKEAIQKELFDSNNNDDVFRKLSVTPICVRETFNNFGEVSIVKELKIDKGDK